MGIQGPPLRSVDVPHDGQCLFSSLAALQAISMGQPPTPHLIEHYASQMREMVAREVGLQYGL